MRSTQTPTAMRLVFFGTPDFAVPSLRALLAGPDPVVGAVSQPDRPAGRGQHLAAPPVKLAALAAGVPVFQPEKVRTAEFLGTLRDLTPDLIVVAAYGKILPAAILDLPARGCINVHASLLPRYRGAAPIQWAILHGDALTGITIMQMNERMDGGDILLQRTTPIAAGETYGELQIRLAELGAAVLIDAVARLRVGTLEPRPQNESEVTLAPLLRKEDGRIDWLRGAEQLARVVRAFNPWPSAYTIAAGRLLKVHRAHALRDPVSGPPGHVAALGEGIRVATGSGTLVLDEVQLEGRKRLPAREFSRGGTVRVGTVLG